MSFSIRLFAVVRWESVIHEFDPWFNYRTTKFLSSEGFYSFLNWFDDRAWYPLGRIVGGTIYPGLMVTAAVLHAILNWLHITINVRNMCVFTAPVFAANTAIATFLMVKEVTRRPATGLLAAAFVGIVPSYISRSVAGSYDNEGVAIFALIYTFYLWVKAVNTGSLAWAASCALAYFYMVAAWGGYVFIINIIPIYVCVLVASGRFSWRAYIAYSTFYVLGSILAMQVPFVGFNVMKQAECAASHGTFVLVQAAGLFMFLRDGPAKDVLQRLDAKAVRRVLLLGLGVVVVVAAGGLIGMQLLGYTQWTGRSLLLLDPTYAKKYIPIIASVSEHQPTSWSSFFFDLHIAVPFAPVGLYFLFQDITDAKIFLILYGTISWYFAGVMVRLMLTLAPAACMLAAVGVSNVLATFSSHLKMQLGTSSAATLIVFDAGDFKPSGKGGKKASAAGASFSSRGASAESFAKAAASTAPVASSTSLIVVSAVSLLLWFYAMHSTYVSSQAYSSPSIVLASQRPDGSRVIFDDFREAYYWLCQNTPEDARIMSWWDYGYQMGGMANRTTLVDNNTWNNTHIATVGRAMASKEDDAYPIMQSLDVDYVLVIFGGYTGYQSDDINKFLWMVRIGGGVFPHIKEPDYFGGGQYRMDAGGSPTMLNSMMYKMSYYRFEEITAYGGMSGFDRARNVEIGHKGYKLKHLEEAFTSEHWIVRIFKVKKPENTLPSPRLGKQIAKAEKAAEFGSPKKAKATEDGVRT
jgi:dolichyl-diphosphooligosaccharide--protein glycosyltransferase